jgi:hypothetical protein
MVCWLSLVCQTIIQAYPAGNPACKSGRQRPGIAIILSIIQFFIDFVLKSLKKPKGNG